MSSHKVWTYQNTQVRYRPTGRMVAINDLWKAAGSPSSLRPDKWFKHRGMQSRLEELAIAVDGDLKRDTKGKLIGVPGILEIVRGGGRSQGTFMSFDLAVDYTKLLSQEVHEWFMSVLLSDPPQSAQVELPGFPIRDSDFGSAVRVTPDGRISVYDAISYVTGHQNPRQVWADLVDRIPVFVQKTDKYKFPGRGGAARPTPVATLAVFLEILVTLPGRIAATVREQAVRTLIRAMNGDPSLVEEIVGRMQGPESLQSLEHFIKRRQELAYQGVLPNGTISSPLLSGQIDSDIRSGYGWKNKTKEMIDLLANLASHMGDMVINRDTPHRPADLAGKVKSRFVPLSLRTVRNLEVLHTYHFDATYLDDQSVTDIFQSRSYPEIAYRDSRSRGVNHVVSHLVAPAGITQAGVERLHELQQTLDSKYPGSITLDAMRLDELVWGVIYPTIQERYQDARGSFGKHHLNSSIRKKCERLCSRPSTWNGLPQSDPSVVQLSLFSELLSGM